MKDVWGQHGSVDLVHNTNLHHGLHEFTAILLYKVQSITEVHLLHLVVVKTKS